MTSKLNLFLGLFCFSLFANHSDSEKISKLVERPIQVSETLNLVTQTEFQKLIEQLNSSSFVQREQAQSQIEALVLNNCSKYLSYARKKVSDPTIPLETERRLKAIIKKTEVDWKKVTGRIHNLVTESLEKSKLAGSRFAAALENKQHPIHEISEKAKRSEYQGAVAALVKEVGLVLAIKEEDIHISATGAEFVVQFPGNSKKFKVEFGARITVEQVEGTDNKGKLSFSEESLISALSPLEKACLSNQAVGKIGKTLSVSSPFAIGRLELQAEQQKVQWTGYYELNSRQIANFFTSRYPEHSDEILEIFDSNLAPMNVSTWGRPAQK